MKTFKHGQRVYCIVATGRWSILLAATYLRTVGGGRVVLQDESGKKFCLPLSKVFGTQEALEANIANLRISVDTETGRITEFPA